MISHGTSLILVVNILVTSGLKFWIQNTGINNPLNWEPRKTPQSCDRISFPMSNDIATYWNIKDIALSGISFPRSGELLFSNNVNLRFRDEAKCPESKVLKYTRSGVKDWLDGDNWKSEFQNKWLPHSERVPCAGEEIRFPSNNIIAVQLPTILLPINHILLGDKILTNEEWSRFLTSTLGFELFKGPDEERNFPWRTDVGCFNKKKCTCARFPYIIRDGIYKEVDLLIFQKAICLYALPKCQPVNCLSPIVPEGHCCGICGAIIKLQDHSEEGYDLNNIKKRVEAQSLNHGYEDVLQTYVGRTRDGNIQIVIVAENSDDTINSHLLANAIARNLTDNFVKSQLTSSYSGLSFYKYFFNSISGIVFGTFICVITIFFVLFYFNVNVLYKKFNLGKNKSFVFARFDNTLNEEESEENLEIGIEPEERENPVQAFDNPIFSANLDKSSNVSSPYYKQNTSGSESAPEKKDMREYHNLIYDEAQNSEKLNFFDKTISDKEKDKNESFDEFSEIKL